jgi:hypothetical protein
VKAKETVVCKSFVLLVFGLILTGVAGADEAPSKAEVLLFQTDHLRSITEPSRLVYRFQKQGVIEPGFEDQVEIIVDTDSGKKLVSANYLNGPRKTDFPPVENAEGNPVLMYFLERDIREMQRLTGGHWMFFKRRIRLAFSEDALVRPVSFLYDGKEVKGNEVRIAPFAADPLRPKFERFADKYYVFTLSEDVPGGVYQIRAVIPARINQGAELKSDPPSKGDVLLEERLTLIH